MYFISTICSQINFIFLLFAVSALLKSKRIQRSRKIEGTNNKLELAKYMTNLLPFCSLFANKSLLVVHVNSLSHCDMLQPVQQSKHHLTAYMYVSRLSVVISLNMYRGTMRAVVTLLPLLGLTWIFGVLTLNKNTTVFAWLFTLFNSLQVSCDQCSRECVNFMWFELYRVVASTSILQTAMSLFIWSMFSFYRELPYSSFMLSEVIM